MPITTLDPVTALVVIDLQQGLTALPATPEPLEAVAARTGRLATAFRRRGLPVVIVTVNGAAPGRADVPRRQPQDRPAGFDEPLPQLGVEPGDHRVTKQRWGAFHGTRLEEDLRALGVTQIVLTGVATTIGVESTARAAFDAGFHVTVATDAVTDSDADAHHHSLGRIFPRMAETGTTDEILAVLDAANGS